MTANKFLAMTSNTGPIILHSHSPYRIPENFIADYKSNRL